MTRVAILTTDNREHHRKYDLPDPYFGPAIEAVLQGLATRSDVEIHVISCTQKNMAAPAKLSANTWFHLLLVPKIGWLRTGYQGCVRAIRTKLREIDPDIVHGQGTERECALSAVFSGFPNVVTLHGNMIGVAHAVKARVGSYLWCAAILERFTLPRTLGVLCNSRYTESMARRLAPRTWHVPNAIRLGFFETLPVKSSTTSIPVLLNVGAICAYKRQLELLKVAEKLHQDGHTFELHFIGVANPSNAYAAAFFERLRRAESKGFARYVGTKDFAELLAAFDEASALVHVPSEEAFGLVVAEALTRKLKVFGTNVGGLPDIAEGVASVELFDDFDSLGLGISRWLRAGCPMTNSAADEMRLRYHPEVIAGMHAEIYQQVLVDAE